MFYNFNQNNSGGYFVEDEEAGIGEYVIIESGDAREAWDKLSDIGSNVAKFWNACPCCGDRWSNWHDDDDGTVAPEIYGTPVAECKAGMFRKKVYIHKLDGTVERVDLEG